MNEDEVRAIVREEIELKLLDLLSAVVTRVVSGIGILASDMGNLVALAELAQGFLSGMTPKRPEPDQPAPQPEPAPPWKDWGADWGADAFNPGFSTLWPKGWWKIWR